MERLFSGKILELLPTANGILFSYINRQFDENTVEICYKMISLENRRLTDVAKNVYMVTKFGNNYKAMEKICQNHITAKAISLPGGQVLLMQENGEVTLTNAAGDLLWQGSFVYRNMTPSDIIMTEKGLWTVYEEGNLLLRYSTETLREELRIGGKNSPFHGPCNLFYEKGELIICNRESCSLLGIDTDTYRVNEYDTFEEPVSAYVSVGGYRFVILDSGLYIMI